MSFLPTFKKPARPSNQRRLLENLNADMDQYGSERELELDDYQDQDFDRQPTDDEDDGCEYVDVDQLSPEELANEIEDLKHDLEEAVARDEDPEVVRQIIENLKCIKAAIESKLESTLDTQDDGSDDYGSEDDFGSDDYGSEEDDFGSVGDNADYGSNELDGPDQYDDDYADLDDSASYDDDYDFNAEDDFDEFDEFEDFDNSSRAPQRGERYPMREGFGMPNARQDVAAPIRRPLQTQQAPARQGSAYQPVSAAGIGASDKDFNQSVEMLVGIIKDKNFSNDAQILDFIGRVIRNQPDAFSGVSAENVLRAYKHRVQPVREAKAVDVDKANSHRQRVDGILRSKPGSAHASKRDYDRKKQKQYLKKIVD